MISKNHIYSQLIRFTLLPTFLLFLASCATNERIDFPITPSTDNQTLFDCTILAIEQHNQMIPELSRIPKNPYYPKKFHTNIASNRDIQKGKFLFKNQNDNIYQFPLRLYRTTSNVTLKSSSSLSQDRYLQSSLIKLSEKLQECLLTNETNTVNDIDTNLRKSTSI